MPKTLHLSIEHIWIVEGREESNPHTGARRGPWYPCGWYAHRTKKEAQKEIESFRAVRFNRGPFRAARYVRSTKPFKF